jgi:hypothetical protein
MKHQAMRKPSGPPKRNKQFNEPEADWFFPRYALSYELPHVPVEPKFFNYRVNTDNAASKYEFSSIEMYSDHQINVDYNLGMRIDLVNKEIYSVNPQKRRCQALASDNGNNNNPAAQEMNEKQLQDLKNQLQTVRDKFILSDKQAVPEQLIQRNEMANQGNSK